MAKTPSVFSNNRHYMPTEELYVADSNHGDITPAFNNIYDVSINFEKSQRLANYISQGTLFQKSSPAGQFLALFCSEALLPGSQIQTSQVDGLRQGVSQNYATFRRYPDINLTWYSQKDYYTNDVFNAWMEFISPTHLSSGGHGSSTQSRRNDAPSFRRLQYPNTYKCPIEITAFSKDIQKKFNRQNRPNTLSTRRSNSITYYLENAFPVSIVASPLAYGKSELIKTTVSFKYEYFYIDRAATNDFGRNESDQYETRNPIQARSTYYDDLMVDRRENLELSERDFDAAFDD